MLAYTPTPIQEIHDSLLDRAGMRLLIKREDLNHPFVSGNKWWKLKYNLQEALNQGQKMLLTFGGAYSNHIFATSAAAKELGLNSIGIIRGEETRPLNNTLSFAIKNGMSLHYISRELYRSKSEKSFTDTLHKEFGNFYLIPEGGTNALAVKGVTEFAQSLANNFDYLCCAVGTGGTMSGLIQGIDLKKKIVGFPVLKAGEFLKKEIENLIGKEFNNWSLMTDYHFGGYAKSTPELESFREVLHTKTSIPLDPVYTAKLFFGVFDLIKKNYFPKGSTVLVLHSGGIQRF